MTRTYYGAPIPRSTGPHPDPMTDCNASEMRDLQQPCEVCGNEERGADDCLTCECPAPLDPDRLREDRDERRRMEREHPMQNDPDRTQTTKKPPKITSDFALLDVKAGRGALAKYLGPGGENGPIPVTITGFITQSWGEDDGTSVEFGVSVTGVKYGKA